MSLYEIRTYTLRVGSTREATQHYQEVGFPAIKKAGFDKHLVGYFFADTGTINQLVHIWRFEDDKDRRAFWARVFADKDFMEGFLPKFRPLIPVNGGEAFEPRALGAPSVRCTRRTWTRSSNNSICRIGFVAPPQESA
jgi:hypothetical protein